MANNSLNDLGSREWGFTRAALGKPATSAEICSNWAQFLEAAFVLPRWPVRGSSSGLFSQAGWAASR